MWRHVVALGLMSLAPFAGSAQDDTGVEAIAGCYVLEIGAWTPPLIDGNEPFQTPPDTLHLHEELGAEDGSPFEVGRHLVRPVIDAGRTPSASWSVDGSGTVEVTWTNGFAGVHLTLDPDGREPLSGTAEAFTDVVGRPVPRAEATLRRIECPQEVTERMARPDISTPPARPG